MNNLTSDLQTLNLVENTPDELGHFSVLPAEILQIIFSFLRPKFLYQNVLPVCRRFRRVLTDEKWWMRRIRKYHLYVPLCEAELENAVFSPARSIPVKHGNPIKSVKLFDRSGERYCISASSATRDFTRFTQRIQLWSLNATTDDSGEIRLVTEGLFNSRGNFGGLEMLDDAKGFISGTNDGTLKLWDIGEAGFSAILSRKKVFNHCTISLQERILACRTKFCTISLLDVENGLQQIERSPFLPRTDDSSYMMSVKLKGNTVYTLFSNQLMTLDVRNLRGGPVHRHVFDLQFRRGLFTPNLRDSYNSMSVADGLIHCCNNGGEISVLQASDLSPCYSFTVSENNLEKMGLNGVIKTSGSVLACTGETVRAFTLGSYPVCIGVAVPDYRNSEAHFDVLREDVIMGTFGGTLNYWPTFNQ